MYYMMRASAPSLHRESIDSLIYIHKIICIPIYIHKHVCVCKYAPVTYHTMYTLAD